MKNKDQLGEKTKQTPSNMDTAKFIDELFGLKDDNTHILTWEKDKPNQKSRWFKNHLEAAAYIKGKTNIYVGAGLSNVNRGPNKCYTTEQVHGSPGFFIDIDVAHDQAHKKKNYPPTFEDARSLIEDQGWDPTMIVHSGHGIQAWWLFKEPLMFDSVDEQLEIIGLSGRLQATILEKAREQGWTIDNTANIGRLTRPIGTINAKDGCEPVEAKVLKTDGPRYNPDDFDEFLIYESKEPSNLKHGSESQHTSNPKAKSEPTSAIKPGRPSESKIISITKEIKEKIKTLTLNENADPPAAKMVQISALFVPEFIRTWNNDRDDELNDTSPSGYDFTLALMAAKCNWSDQEIMDLMVAFRREHGHKLHLDNKQKYVRTIIKAKNAVQDELDTEIIEEASTLTGTPYEDKDTNRRALSSLLGINILKIIKHLTESRTYEIVVQKKDGAVNSVFMSSTQLLRYDTLEAKMLDVAGEVLKLNDKKKGGWYRVKKLIASIVEEREVPREAMPEGQLELWIQDYMKNQPIRDKDTGAENKKPFFHTDGYWYLFADKFYEWTQGNKRNKDTKAKMCMLMRDKLKMDNPRFDAKKADGTRTSIRPWHIPTKIVPQRPGQSTKKSSGKSNVIPI